MKHLLIVILLVMLVLPGFAQRPAVPLPPIDTLLRYTSDSRSSYYYPDLLKRFVSCDTTLTDMDVALLYIGYSSQDAYSPYSVDEDSVADFTKRKEWKKAVETGERMLLTNPVSINLHYNLYVAYRELGENENSLIHFWKGRRLLDGILVTGKGTSMKEPFIVITPHDEYEVLAYLGYRSTLQSLLESDRVPLDMLKATNRKVESDTTDFFFNISLPFTALDRQLRKEIGK